MVGRTGTGTNLATRVRHGQPGWLGRLPFQIRNNPTTFGHNAAANANSVAAYRYTFAGDPDQPLHAGLRIVQQPAARRPYFDASGTRLAVPESRKKPDMAAPDGGDTTFFFPARISRAMEVRTSSAPVPPRRMRRGGGLLLQKAGGPNSLTPKQIKILMQTAAPARVAPNSGGGADQGLEHLRWFRPDRCGDDAQQAALIGACLPAARSGRAPGRSFFRYAALI